MYVCICMYACIYIHTYIHIGHKKLTPAVIHDFFFSENIYQYIDALLRRCSWAQKVDTRSKITKSSERVTHEFWLIFWGGVRAAACPHLALQCVAVCCSVLQCVVKSPNTQNEWPMSFAWYLEEVYEQPPVRTQRCSVLQCVAVCCRVLQCVAVCCSVLQCVAVCCSALQSVAVCFSVLQCIAVRPTAL